MTADRPEVVAWRWRKPVVNDHGETVGGVWELGGAPAFLPWWTSEPLVRLNDYEALKVECRILESELATVKRVAYVDLLDERDKLRVECEKLVEALDLFVSNPTPTSEDFDKAHAALAAYRKQGGG